MDTFTLPKVKRSLYSLHIKRLLDIVLSLIAIVILAPLMLIVAILELIIHGRPILYTSMRPGKNEKLFKMYKFRSMNNKTGDNGELLPGKNRVTKFGRILRRTSIDELPELINVIKGDMSIIGPRPLLKEYLERYPDRYKVRHAIRPGLACPWIKREGEERRPDFWTWREQFEMEVYYIENISVWVDIKLIIATVHAVLTGSKERVQAVRVAFNGENLDETRTLDEIVAESSEKVTITL